MDRIEIQKLMIDSLIQFNPPKWNECHTEERTVFRRLPKHLWGRRETRKALEELYKMEFIIRYKKTGETHISLNIRKKKEIEEFLEI